jgi:hypothetical protein
MTEGFCDKHGPYDASQGRCPFCARERGLPQAPPPLDDELETDPWGGREQAAYIPSDEEETDPGGRAQLYQEELDEITQWPQKRIGDWEDDEEVTQLPDRPRNDWDDDATVVERSETGLLGFLIVKDGMRRGQVHKIRNGTTIGRKEAKILIRDSKISKSHAKFTIEEGQFHVWDFGTPNGTFVNGNRIREATALLENDEVRMGDTTFVLKTLA